MAEPKTKKTEASVEDFIATVPDETKRQDSIRLVDIFREATGEEPKMWGSSIIGFGQYHYVYASGREGDWLLTGFSPRKANLTLYIMSGFDEYADVSGYDPKPLLDKLGPYATGKSCLYIKSLQAIDIDTLKQLIKLSYDHMKKTNKSS